MAAAAQILGNSFIKIIKGEELRVAT